MNDTRARVATGASLAVAVVALLAAWFARQGVGEVPHPADAITQQSMVTAPPVTSPAEAATRTSAMGGPPAPANASR